MQDKKGAYGRILAGAAEFGQIDWDTNYRRVLELF